MKHGSHFTLNDFESADMNGRTRLHQVCMADSRSTSKRKALGMLLVAGAKIDSRVSRSWSPENHQTLGFTCLHSLVHTAHRKKDQGDLESLTFLIQHGADTLACDHHQNTVSMRAYLPNENDNYYSSKGSYRGDLWDAALVICGYELTDFRASYPRVARYNKNYSREDFERLWLGKEHLCPYWDDKRYPETGGSDDYWRQPSQRRNHTSCPECKEHHAELFNPDPHIDAEADLPSYSQPRELRLSPTPSDPEYGHDGVSDDMYEMGLDMALELQDRELEEAEWELQNTAFADAEEKYLEPTPSPCETEDPFDNYQRLMGSDSILERHDDDDEFLDGWMEYYLSTGDPQTLTEADLELEDTALAEEELFDQADNGISPSSSEDGEAAYRRLMGSQLDMRD